MELTARPREIGATLAPGTSDLPLGNGRVGVLYVPVGPVRGLVVALHGAGGEARSALRLLRADADRCGLVVLAPASSGSTWAVLHRRRDVDTPAVDAALAEVLAAYPFDPATVSVAGFSDGASYAISLGLANGDLLRRVVAFSPGFQVAGRRQGRPGFFVTHGVGDTVLPISRTSRRLVPALRSEGYEVIYTEFQGGHVVPAESAAAATDWLVESGARR